MSDVPGVVGDPAPSRDRQDQDPWWETFPWWAVLFGGILALFGYYTFFSEDYTDAWRAIAPGLTVTIRATLVAFFFALVIGLVAGFGRVSRNVVARTLSRTYIEFFRGIPTLPFLFFVAFVLAPDFASAIGVPIRDIEMEWRGIAALALVYGGFIAEVIRGGIQSIDRGQVEAGRSLGLSYGSTMRSIVLPQAVRNVLPPLGNDFVAMLKDSSLLSVLAIREITQNAKLKVNTSFQPRETYVVLTFTYLVLVISLSLALTQLERYLTKDRVGAR